MSGHLHLCKSLVNVQDSKKIISMLYSAVYIVDIYKYTKCIYLSFCLREVKMKV